MMQRAKGFFSSARLKGLFEPAAHVSSDAFNYRADAQLEAASTMDQSPTPLETGNRCTNSHGRQFRESVGKCVSVPIHESPTF